MNLIIIMTFLQKSENQILMMFQIILKFFTNCCEEREYTEIHENKEMFYNSFEIKKEFSFMEIYILYNILKSYNILTNLSWMKLN